MQNKIIGIIGGAGVAATNKLNTLIEEHFTANGAFRDAHHPEIIIYQAVNVPSRSMYLEGRGESFIPGYIEIGKKLKSLQASLLCMSCNTAHFAIDTLETEIGLPFLNMVEKTVQIIAQKYKNKKIGIMASDGCLIGRVYEKYIEKYIPGCKLIYPSAEMQKEVTRGIINVKNKNRFLAETHPDRPRQIFKNVCSHLSDNNAEVIISGCTDISVDFPTNDFTPAKIIDSLTVLADLITNHFQIAELQKTEAEKIRKKYSVAGF